MVLYSAIYMYCALRRTLGVPIQFNILRTSDIIHMYCVHRKQEECSQARQAYSQARQDIER